MVMAMDLAERTSHTSPILVCQQARTGGAHWRTTQSIGETGGTTVRSLRAREALGGASKENKTLPLQGKAEAVEAKAKERELKFETLW